jgi:hypothetical protein
MMEKEIVYSLYECIIQGKHILCMLSKRCCNYLSMMVKDFGLDVVCDFLNWFTSPERHWSYFLRRPVTKCIPIKLLSGGWKIFQGI